MEYEVDLVLKQSDLGTAAFDYPITITKEMFFDFNCELMFELNGEIIKNQWAKYFVKDYISDELMDWLRNKEFYVKMVPVGKHNKLTRKLYFIKEEDRLHYLLKFASN